MTLIQSGCYLMKNHQIIMITTTATNPQISHLFIELLPEGPEGAVGPGGGGAG